MVKNPRKDSLEVSIRTEDDTLGAIRRFAKMFRNSGLVQELMERRHYEKPSVKRKRKHVRAVHASREPEKEE